MLIIFIRVLLQCRVDFLFFTETFWTLESLWFGSFATAILRDKIYYKIKRKWIVPVSPPIFYIKITREKYDTFVYLILTWVWPTLTFIAHYTLSTILRRVFVSSLRIIRRTCVSFLGRLKFHKRYEESSITINLYEIDNGDLCLTSESVTLYNRCNEPSFVLRRNQFTLPARLITKCIFARRLQPPPIR